MYLILDIFIVFDLKYGYLNFHCKIYYIQYVHILDVFIVFWM